MLAPLAVLLTLFSAVLAMRRRRRRRLPARAVIVSPRQSTVIAHDGAVRSVQSAQFTVARADLDRLWNATNLENLARTYWRFLSRVTLGLIRVVYGHNERSVVFLARPFKLLRFEAPEYVLEADHGNVRWRIRDGLLVARGGRGCGYLEIDVRREPEQADREPEQADRDPEQADREPEQADREPEQADREPEQADRDPTLTIEVAVANFYPAIAASFSSPVYEATQSSIHVLVTHAFLRSLAKLDLAESKVGVLAGLDGDAGEQAPTPATQP